MKNKQVYFGKIDSQIIGNFANLNYKIRKQFSDDETVENWKSIGHLYVNYTGFLIDQISGIPSWCDDVLNYLKKDYNILDATMSLYCMPPGTIMPEHGDIYKKYSELKKIEDINDICRILVFLEEWKSGHYFEINGVPITNWKSGDYCMWRGNTPHIAANIGKENRYTLQITTIL